MNTSIPYKEVEIKIDTCTLKGNLRLAENSKGIVLFSHGSGSSRWSTRNNFVADFLLKKGYSSILFDLLTLEEDEIYKNRFNINLLTKRLVQVTKWSLDNKVIKDIPVLYFGASTGAASALEAAVIMGDVIQAVVSRGGRPDLVMPILAKVKTPTLLIVGGNDTTVIAMNEKAVNS